ncbi:hypothetical protein [Desulfovibrio sp. SGI.169]|uniref:hypothetical protein n=1 Tax=Desulfovibrio sp. SGI.169 TaxID=3420561 RepID=UPI003CFF3FAA
MMNEGELKQRYQNSYNDRTKRALKPEHYIRLYFNYLGRLADREISFLELGIFDGNSLEFFAGLLPKATVCGVDINECGRVFSTPRIKTYTGSQDSAALYDKILAENGMRRFDVIVDDCSHIGTLTQASFKLLFPLLAPGGLYVIEDWGTGYWPRFPGGKKLHMAGHMSVSQWIPRCLSTLWKGMPLRLKFLGERFKSHQSGIPGFLKQLADEVGMGDAACDHGLGTMRRTDLEYLHIYPGIAFMRKRP